MDAPFIHLRVHSSYSLAESMLPIDTLVGRVAEHNQPAVAVTDSFNSFGALEFSEYAAAKGLQPIIGAQLILSEGDENLMGEVALLVQNEQGWQNLSTVMSTALLKDSLSPKLTLEALRGHTDGLIVLSGGAKRGFIAGVLADGAEALAEKRLMRLNEMFPGRVYVELQRHGTRRESLAEPALIALAYKHNLPLVATNDCYFLDQEDFEAHEILLCISQSMTLNHQERRRETKHHYLKTSAEMTALFADLPEACINTSVIAKRCAYRVPTRKPMLPAFITPDGLSEEELLTNLAREGLEKKLSRIETDHAPYHDRLKTELGVITSMGFAGYFLIVADFIGWAKAEDIPVGAGRGSGAGSLVAYALGITGLDPMRWGLLFERFLNPERISMPDFDIDFCQDRREQVIDYVQGKYGKLQVAQIITFGTLQARAALRDVGRVLGMPYGQVDRIAKLIPFNPAHPVKIHEALESEEELRKAREEDEQVANLIEISCRLEGLNRHASTHAAGLVIGDRPLMEIVPITRDVRSVIPVTQFNMKWVEEAGLVKFDFLGLRTLTILKQTLSLLGQKGVDLDLEDIPLDDEATFAMLGEGNTTGMFQLESTGVREVLRSLKPDRFEDIVAVVALYRPGPMQNIPQYVSRKHGREDVDYMHPWLEPILSETYGIMIYQEQVLEAARVLAGYTLGGADILRRAMGKKIEAVMDEQRATFIKGAGDNKIDAELAGRIFKQISAFAGYGFNKSHAVGYALLAWQTAWLKAHHPTELFAATMTLDMGNSDRLSVLRQDCRQCNITVLPPSVNTSDAVFTVENYQDKSAIRYGLGAIKNVGAGAMKELARERQDNGAYASLEDFADRAAYFLSRKTLENMIKAGALDCFEHNRATLFGSIEQITSFSQASKREREIEQENLFNGVEGIDVSIPLNPLDEWEVEEKLTHEMAALGMYLSAHPLDDYRDKLEKLRVTYAKDIISVTQKAENAILINIAGMIVGKKIRTSSKGHRFAFIELTDPTGIAEISVFSELLSRAGAMLEKDTAVYVKAEASYEQNRLRLRAETITLLDEEANKDVNGVVIYVADATALEGVADGVKSEDVGKISLYLRMHVQSHEVTVNLPGLYKVGKDFRQRLKSITGAKLAQEIIT